MNVGYWTKDEIVSVVVSKGYVLLEDYMYMNYRRIIIKDVQGYKYDTDFYVFRKDYKTRAIDKKNPFVLENISTYLYINKKSFSLTKDNSYSGSLGKLVCHCFKCDKDFNTSWNAIRLEYGCKHCKLSKGERRISEWLEENNIAYEIDYKFPECRNIFPLSFDFYIEELNLAIEYNGEQHYNKVGYFGGDEKLKRSKKNDRIRKKYCRNNEINFLIIPYTSFEKIKIILESKVRELKKWNS